MSDLKQIIPAIRNYSKFRYWVSIRHEFTPEQRQEFDDVRRYLAMADAEVIVSYLVDESHRGTLSNLFTVRISPPKPEPGRSTLRLPERERQPGEGIGERSGRRSIYE